MWKAALPLESLRSSPELSISSRHPHVTRAGWTRFRRRCCREWLTFRTRPTLLQLTETELSGGVYAQKSGPIQIIPRPWCEQHHALCSTSSNQPSLSLWKKKLHAEEAPLGDKLRRHHQREPSLGWPPIHQAQLSWTPTSLVHRRSSNNGYGQNSHMRWITPAIQSLDADTETRGPRQWPGLR